MYLYRCSGKTRGEWADKVVKAQRNESDNTSITTTEHKVKATEMRVGRAAI